MGCFSCFGSGRKENEGNGAASSSAVVRGGGREDAAAAASRVGMTLAGAEEAGGKGSAGEKDLSVLKKIPTQTFTFRELAAATRNFRDECFIGEGGFGRVYKGRLDGTGQIVAIKQLNKDGHQGNQEFQVEVVILSLLHHENLVNLVGYCVDGDQRLLVYEYMPLGSLEDHLHDLPPDHVPLDWNTRMKIAAGAAKGLEYLHDKRKPPIIYRDLKSSNILLGEGFHPKLSDFGLAKLGPVGDKSHVSTRVMGTYGYCAPEYAMTGQLTIKSDIYSFGVVLLELITGRKAIDGTRPRGEKNLVSWARPLFKAGRKFRQMADPGLAGRYPTRGLYQAIAVACMCLQSEAACRPLIGEVVAALTYLANQAYDPNSANTSKKGGGSERVSRVVDCGSAPSKKDDSASSWHKSPNKDREDSPREQHRIMNREQMVAEAKMWGESWREKRRAAASSHGSLDSPSGSRDS